MTLKQGRELYLVYYPDVLTSSKSDTTFACSHGFPWEGDTRIPLIFYDPGDGAPFGDMLDLDREVLGNTPLPKWRSLLRVASANMCIAPVQKMRNFLKSNRKTQ